MRQSTARALRALAAAMGGALACGAASASGTVALHSGVFWPGVFPGYPMVAPLPWAPGACGLYLNCQPPWWDERRHRMRPMPPAPPPSPAAETDLWGGSGSPWGYVRRLPPPTPESQIQPQYRDASTIRPEFLQP